MDNGWSETTLGELCDRGEARIQTGPFGSQLHSYDYQPSGVPVVPTEGIGRRRLREDEIPRVSEAVLERLSRHKLKTGDILFARRGVQATGLSAIVEPKHEGWLCGTGAILLRLETTTIDSQFLSFALSSDVAVTWLKSHAVGAVMPNLNEGVLRRMPLRLPPLSEQRAIASVLGSLDDKIELNRRMNETLEALAQSLFKSWFVDATQSALPKGWRESTIGELCEFAYGKALKAETRRAGSIPVYGSNGRVGWHDEALVKGPGIVVGRKGNPGIVIWSPTDFFPIDTTFYVVPKGECRSLYFLFHALRSHDLASLGADSAVPGLNRNMAYMSTEVLPPADLQEAFDRQVRPLFERVHHNIEESRTLAALRDALLPKLLSGELRVPQTLGVA